MLLVTRGDNPSRTRLSRSRLGPEDQRQLRKGEARHGRGGASSLGRSLVRSSHSSGEQAKVGG